jgi:hypothetical protein
MAGKQYVFLSIIQYLSLFKTLFFIKNRQRQSGIIPRPKPLLPVAWQLWPVAAFAPHPIKTHWHLAALVTGPLLHQIR